MKPANSIVTCAAALCAMAAAPVSALTVYSNDFNTAIGSAWSVSGAGNTLEIERSDWIDLGNDVVVNDGVPGEHGDFYLGLGGNDNRGFQNQIVSLSLTSLLPHTAATLKLDLLAVSSWDGNPPTGPDIFGITVNSGPSLLFTSFANNINQLQSYPDSYPSLPGHPSGTGAYFFHLSGESRYHLAFTFDHTASDLQINFFGLGLNDEGWGLENVTVEVAPIPLPPAIILLCTGLAGLGAIRRRK